MIILILKEITVLLNKHFSPQNNTNKNLVLELTNKISKR